MFHVEHSSSTARQLNLIEQNQSTPLRSSRRAFPELSLQAARGYSFRVANSVPRHALNPFPFAARKGRLAVIPETTIRRMQCPI
jgi:hypothetical protein